MNKNRPLKQKMNLVTVRTFQNYFTAQIIYTKLKSAGIICSLSDSSTASVAPFLSTAIGGIKLVIRKEDEEEVLQLLADFDEEYRQNAVCPRCGENAIEKVATKSTGNIIGAVLSWFLGDFAMAKTSYQCSNCKYESDTLPENYQPGKDSIEEQMN